MSDIRTDRDWGSIQPDARYDVGSVDVRFEVPLGVSWDSMKLIAAPVVAKAIEQFERLGDGYGHKWKHYDKIDIQYHVSRIPSQAHLDYFNSLKGSPDSVIKEGRRDWLAKAASDLEGSMVGMVARVWFIRPLALVNKDLEEEYKKSLNDSVGFVPLDEMKKIIKENTLE